MPIRYIFSINTGRAGSGYLTKLLSKAQNTFSTREPLPVMMGEPMQKFNEGEESALRDLMPLKLSEIEKSRGRQGKTYCETNHLFIKGWGYLIPEHIPQEEIGVIILRRDLGKIIHSMLQSREIPGITHHANAWLLDPRASRNLSRLPAEADLYERCEWYIREIFLRTTEYQQRFPKITYWDCDLEQLKDYEFVLRMFGHFGLTPTSDLQEIIEKPINIHSEWPNRTLNELLRESEYPRADEFPPEERDRLLKEMVAYLHQHKAEQIAAWEPNPTKNGSLNDEAINLVADCENELEKHFQVALKFTDMEYYLTWELLRSVDKHDLASMLYIRTTEPAIAYTMDLNYAPTPRNLIKRAGIRGLMRIF